MVDNVPSPVSPMSPNTFSQQYSETPDIQHLQLSNEQLVRRNSLSLRSPPFGSIADEVLNTPQLGSNTGTGITSHQHYNMARNILSNLKEMTERFSDFASFESGVSETDSLRKERRKQGSTGTVQLQTKTSS